MSTKSVRWIICGATLLAFLGLAGCNGLSSGTPTVTLAATPSLLKGPNGTPWPQLLNSQTTNGVCDPTKEAGPTQ